MRARIWKTFYLGAQSGRDLQSARANFPAGDHTIHFDMVGGGAILESDLSIRELRALFRFAGASMPDYVRDTKPSWESEETAPTSNLVREDREMRTIHHLDGDPNNNDPSNLRIVGNEEKNQAIPSGQILKDNSLKAAPSDKSTMRPWAQNGTYIMAASYDDVVVTQVSGRNRQFELPRFENEANAELIVQAVNAHDALVGALKELGQYTAALEMMLNTHPEGEPLVNARAVLSLVEGGQ